MRGSFLSGFTEICSKCYRGELCGNKNNQFYWFVLGLWAGNKSILNILMSLHTVGSFKISQMGTELNCLSPRCTIICLGTVVEISEDWLGTPYKWLKEHLKTNTWERVHNQPSISLNSYFKSKNLNGKNAFVSWIAEFKKKKKSPRLCWKINNLPSGNDFAAWSSAMPILD